MSTMLFIAGFILAIVVPVGVVLVAIFLSSPRSEPSAPSVCRYPEWSGAGWTGALTAKFGIAGTAVMQSKMTSPLPWVGESGVRTNAFARWTVDTGKCIQISQASQRMAEVADCATSFSGFVFQGLAGQLRLMIEPEFCLTGTNATLKVSSCSSMPDPTQNFTLHEVGHCEGDQPVYALAVGDGTECISLQDTDDRLVLQDCNTKPLGLKLVRLYNEEALDLRINPNYEDNFAGELGETYMGNPGVQLPWDVAHLVQYPWAGDHCAQTVPHVSGSQSCYSQFRASSDGMSEQCDSENVTLLGDGAGCSGFCDVASNDRPCSCGTLSCPGCLSGFGYTAVTNSSWLPPGCIFVGCTRGADPARPEGTFNPLLIPGGLNIRTCPDNILDGRSPWTQVAPISAPRCEVNAACANEQFVGTMVLSGENFSFCCPGETSNPFSALGLGYFGLMPENGHYGEPAVTCNATGCSYRPSCACPLSVPSLNIRVTGPSTSLGVVFVPAVSAYDEAQGLSYGSERIVVAPDLDAASTLRIYAVAVGADDSFHVGNNVSLNSPGIQDFINNCGLPCERRHECPAITLPYYPGFGGPKEINPSGQWDVKQPPPSIFDDRRILIAPRLRNSSLKMGPVFIGNPGKTYVGTNPDLRGIFHGVEGRKTTGPGSSPGGTTSVGTEWLKAFFQCKESLATGTEYDPRIWY
ncbi:unnamed protein product [Symbiodinium sp. CCMP2456]|nr:unnamed protein product [Symbiodinium sp. CCMP2456]